MSYILIKVKDNIRKYGLITSIKRAFKKISNIFLTFLTNIIFGKRYKFQVEEILGKRNYKKVIVFYPFFDFNMPNFQRFQQIAMALGDIEDILFFYCTPNNIYDSIFGFKNIKNNLYVTNQYNLLVNMNIENRCMYFVSTDIKSSLQDIQNSIKRNDTVLYDYVDEMHKDIIGSVDQKLLNKHKYVLENKDIIITVTADKLLKEVQSYRKDNVHLVTNGVCVEDFEILPNEKIEDEKLKKLIDFKNNVKVTICYYGALAKWFDYELIKYIVKDKNIGVVLIGIDYDLSFKESNLESYDNILYLGAIEYKKLKFYASECDIMTIPFIVNELTDSTSPVKLFEYMALKKPIIVTNMLECRKYKSICIAKTYKEFLNLIYKLSENDNKLFDKELTFNESLKNSWSSKVNEILKVIDG